MDVTSEFFTPMDSKILSKNIYAYLLCVIVKSISKSSFVNCYRTKISRFACGVEIDNLIVFCEFINIVILSVIIT